MQVSVWEIFLDDNETCMTAKELIEIVKESNLWAPLTEEEKQEVINHALKCRCEMSAGKNCSAKEES